jgi:hypothetical protein
MTLQKITEFYTEWFSVCSNIPLTFCTTAIFKKALSNKIMNQIKLVDMPMIFYCAKLHSSKCKDS